MITKKIEINMESTRSVVTIVIPIHLVGLFTKMLQYTEDPHKAMKVFSDDAKQFISFSELKLSDAEWERKVKPSAKKNRKKDKGKKKIIIPTTARYEFKSKD